MSATPTSIVANDQRLREAIAPLVASARERPVFLVDGDRTLVAEDTSRLFLAEAGFDFMAVKERFRKDGYVYDSFRFHAETHLGLGESAFSSIAPRIAARVQLYDGAVGFLRAASSHSIVAIVSAGIPRLWRRIMDVHGLQNVAVIGGIEPRNPFVFGRREKGLVARLFATEASGVVGVGDSDVDAEMLRESRHAVIVVNHRKNEDLLPQLAGHPSVWQIVPAGAPHEGIRLIGFADVESLQRLD
jgi:phosphoserine phosphatase